MMPTYRPALRTALIGAIVMAAPGCSEADPEGAASLAAIEGSAFADIFAIEDTTVLQENADVINVAPNVEIDGDSLYLIADEREKQMRVYTPTGAISVRFGRKGQGPGEFFAPTRMIRLKSGALLVSDILSRLTMYSAEGDSLIGSIGTPFTRIYDIDLLSDSTLLVTGILSQSPNKRLHLFSLADTTVVRSFFAAPSLPPAALDAAGFAMTSIHNDTIYATLSLVDSIYRFSQTGKRYPAIPVSGIRFRPLPPAVPSSNSRPREIADWYASFSMLSQAIPFTNGFLLIYQDRRDMVPVWHAAVLDRKGSALADIPQAPMYIGAFSDGRFAFVHPGSETPNRWAIVRLSEQVQNALRE